MTPTQHIPMTREDRPQYFDDPAIDRLLQMFLELSAEVWAVKDWQFVVTQLLEQKGVVTQADINNYQATGAAELLLAEQREQFTRRLLQHISGKVEPLQYT